MVFRFLKVCSATLLIGVCVPTVQAENWTSLDGSRTVVGSLVGMWDNHAVLLLEDGRRVSVPLSGLIAASRIQAEKLSVQIADRRESLNKELLLRAKAEAAPAPDPLPTLPEPAPVAKISDADDAATTLNTVASELRAGHISVLWDALPSTYQSDLQTLVRLSAVKLDPLKTEVPLASLHNLADLIVTRQNWIASHPKMIASASDDGPNEKVAFFREILLPFANSIRAGLPPDATRLESLQSVNLDQWFQQRDRDMAPFLAHLMTQAADDPPLWELVDSTDDAATVKKSTMETPSTTGYPNSGASGGLTVQMSRVQNRWVPAGMATGWSEWVKRHTETLEQSKPGTLSISDLFGASATTATSANYDSEFPGSGYAGAVGTGQNPMIMMLSSLEQLPMLDPTVNLLRSPTEAITFHEAVDQLLASFSMTQELMQTLAPPPRPY